MSAEEVVPDQEILDEAAALLESPDLLATLENFIERSGLVGEEINRRLILLAGIGGHVGRPIHVIVKGESSGGKNNLVTASLSPMPRDRIERAAHLSEKFLSYAGSLEGVLFIEEAEGQVAAEYAIRVAMSEGKVGNMTLGQNGDGRWETQHKEAEVSASIITTTTSPSLHPENQTRVFDVEIDSSAKLTRRVLDSFADRARGISAKPDDQETKLIRTAIGLLQPLDEILIPFADTLVDRFPSTTVRARRDFPRVLCLIEASAVLHQRQRERDESDRLVADVEDYRIVYPVLQQVLGASMTGLTETARKLCGLHDELVEEQESIWLRRTRLEEAAQGAGIASQNTVHKWCRRLTRLGIWEGDQRGSRNAWYHRKLRDPDDGAIDLPDPDMLTEKVTE